MAAFLVLLLALALAFEAHRRGRTPQPRALRVALAAFVLGVLTQRTLFLTLAPPGAPPSLLVAALAAALGLAAWTGQMWLLACEARRRDLVVRGIFGALALASAPASLQLSAMSTAIALFSFRWTRHFGTGQRLLLGLAFLALLIFDVRAQTPDEESLRGATAALITVARWTSMVTFVSLLLGVFALFRAFLSDPSLGIRTVGRRLALSHVLVVGLPLLLLGLLWTFSTVLGVNAERAMVAARALEWEGAQMRSALGEVLASGSRAREAAAGRVAARGRDWSGARLWLREGERWERLIGDSLGGESRLARWLDSLSVLPPAGVIGDVAQGRYGAALLDPADSDRGAILLVDVDSLLLGSPARIAQSRLAMTLRDMVARGGSLTTVGEGGVPPGAVVTRKDSIDLERARHVLRRLGIPDSALRTQRNRPGISFQTPEDTVSFRGAGVPGGNLLLDGHALVPGLSWTGERWRSTRSLLSSSLDAPTALAGLFRNIRENPASVVPVILIGGLTLLVLLVAVFDFMVVAGLARSITAAIRGLQGGAARLEAGDLAHRIEVRGKDDLWSVAGAFNQAIAGFERSRKLEIERGRLENELALARQIQERLLPAGPPTVPGLEIAGHYDPARQVGGDYYDHLELGDGRVLLVIADVSGKGVPASLLMSGFRASLMSQDLSTRDPVALAVHLNEFLLKSVELGKFVTAFLAFADSRAGTLDYVNAGHNAPLLVRADGSPASLTEGGLMLGVMPGTSFDRGRTAFEAGDLLVLYTDGVTEGASPTQELWGDDRLLESVRRGVTRPCADLATAIATEVRAFEGEDNPADDITLLLARRV